MKVRTTVLFACLCGLCVCPSRVAPQIPHFGRLSVATTPSDVKGQIVIDSQDRGVQTNYTFGMSQGEHSVSLGNLPKCKDAVKVLVSDGKMTTINCNVQTGWDKPTTR